MIDKASFGRVDPDYELPTDSDNMLEGRHTPESLTEDELLLASPIVYGFSFADKLWRQYPRIIHFHSIAMLTTWFCS